LPIFDTIPEVGNDFANVYYFGRIFMADVKHIAVRLPDSRAARLCG